MQAGSMVPKLKMKNWSNEIEQELITLIKDWLKQIGKTQSELCQRLGLPSSRMPILINFLKKEYKHGGIPQVASRLCEIDSIWEEEQGTNSIKKVKSNPFGQLDLLDEICDDLSKINFNK